VRSVRFSRRGLTSEPPRPRDRLLVHGTRSGSEATLDCSTSTPPPRFEPQDRSPATGSATASREPNTNKRSRTRRKSLNFQGSSGFGPRSGRGGRRPALVGADAPKRMSRCKRSRGGMHLALGLLPDRAEACAGRAAVLQGGSMRRKRRPRPIPERKLRKRLVRKALHDQGGVCHWCRKPLTPETVTADHLIPCHAGGQTRAGNIVAACGPCNSSRCSEDVCTGRLPKTAGDPTVRSPFEILQGIKI
jgi:hypothetical protein